MQTILLQDTPALFRGLEHSVLCREGINLVTANAGSDLLEACRRSGAQVVLLQAGTPGGEISPRLESLSHGPLCLVIRDEDEARSLMPRVLERLGLPGRKTERVPCRVPVTLRAGRAACRGRTRDLSPGGVFVGTDRGGDLSGAVEVTFRGTGEHPGFTCRGTVVRCVKGDDMANHLPGVAVSFAADRGLSAPQVSNLLAASRR